MMRLRTTLFAIVVVATTLVPSRAVVRAADNDAGAGSWAMIVLGSPAQFNLPAPLSTSSIDYQSELSEIRSAQAQMNAGERSAIEYWSKGGVVRWNEIMIELVSRADLPPAPRADGTYPVPDANNPFADPNFPFGNPPYASRAYSYVSVAQYEALKTAWYFKYLYNRAAPSKVDTSIKPLIASNDLPAYPSEDAVLAGVTVPLLKLLFPVSAGAIDAKAAEQLQVAKLSGKATASDIAAGYALGEAIAQVMVARARTDGMGTAGGNAEIWKALTDAARARGDVAWVSQDIPPRPPMLPLFGKVKTWMLTSADIEKERPGPPPLASDPLMQRDLAEVRQIVGHLTREQRAIAIKWADGVSTPTPPGHWNFIAESYVSDAKWSEVRAARAFALLDMALHDAAVACWDTKYYYSNARPAQLDPQIKTAIGLPNFPSYTSGHSTFSGAAAEVLSYLFPGARSTFEAYSDEAAMSRLYGGIHYRTDNEVGTAHGKRIGGYTVQFARTDGADR